ncbi:MAG: YbaK/EbsC family protein [bacterium]
MAIPKKVLDLLNKNKIKHEIVKHKLVYTGYDLANTLKEKLEKVAKILVIKADKGFALLVLPASHRLNFNKLKKALGAKKVEIIKEASIQKLIKMKPGTQTPFAVLHKLPVYIDQGFAKTGQIITSAGSYSESLRLQIKDLVKTGAEVVESFTDKSDLKLPQPKKIVKKVKKRVCRKVCKKK